MTLVPAVHGLLRSSQLILGENESKGFYVETLDNYINGAFRAPAAGNYLEVRSPATGEIWGRIARSSAEDVEAAVAAASRAGKSGPWPSMTATQRGHVLRKLGDLARDHADELTRLDVRDNGKSYKEMLGQAKRIPEYYYFYAGIADKLDGAVIAPERPGHFNYINREPIGVIAMITPWNSPLMLLAWKLAPALAAGNTAVVKPSELTSASAVRFAQLAATILPPGVLNVVTGLGNEVGAPLAGHPGVGKVAFTGGVHGGRAVYELAARHLKPVSLELGGKSPNIVFEDADLEMAARGVVSGIFGSGGQSCVAGSRLLVQESIHDRFVERVLELSAKIRLGDPMAMDTDVGPVANRMQFDKILSLIEQGKQEGATLAAGGNAVSIASCKGGLFVEPTIFTDVKNDMRIAQEEVFGPVLCVIRFKDEAEALAIANDTEFGLGAGLWTRDVRRVHRLAGKIQAGSVWVNTYKGTSFLLPFGGYKMSGLGREGGVEAIFSFMQVKSVSINLTDEIPYGFPV